MPKGVATSAYDYLLENKDFRRWYDNVSRGSIVTAHTWLRRMGLIHKRFEKTPKQIASMNPKQATAFILDTISALEKDGLSGSYIAGLVKPIKSWLEFNNVSVQQKIKIHNRNELVRFADERPPTPDELLKIFNAADLRSKTACAVVAFTGVRLEILGSYLGDDGLKLKDFPELTIGKESVDFNDTPTMIVVRKPLSKTGKQFFTFLCEEGCDYLKQYLEWRIRRGEKLVADSPLITPLQQNLAGEHIRTINIGDLMRKPIRAAGYKWRPYVLRRYFDTRLMMAEADGLIINDWRTFWMGHAGTIEAVYTVSKGLSKDVIEKMRQGYAKGAEKYLTTGKKGVTEEQILKTMNRQFLIMSGYSEEELKDVDIAALTPAQFQELIQKKSMRSLGLNGNGRQKVVPMDEIKSWIVQGWDYVKDLPNGEAIIKLPLS